MQRYPSSPFAGLFSAIGRIALCAVLLTLLVRPASADSGPFETCPSKAFLIQQTVATLYGVNLATGYYTELSADLGTDNKINALAFNFHDDYLYGWGYEFGAPVRIDSEYQATPLSVDGLPATGFYVGDIAVEDNTYYLYRPGSDYGLYAIDLDPPAGTPLQMVRVIDGASLNLAIFDMAFHPDNGFAYAVDRGGKLYEIDATAGSARLISNVGQSGTFGAAYFDVDGFLYISRNSDGFVFRIDPSQAEPVAEFYAYGPSSSNNDGARCALAPIIDESDTNIDFGDAPASYGTTFSNNGARHDLLGSTVFLGDSVDGESDAFLQPLSDDEADRKDDEDGIRFVTGFELGEPAIIIATASSDAYLNAWIDWNQDGSFGDDERVIAARFVAAGDNNLTITTPVWAQSGATWARFRLSSTVDIGPTGGVGDGEVEDYELRVTATGVTETIYPSANSFSTLAYEDNWPLTGDYDMNDLVVHVRMRELVRDERVIGVEVDGEIVAVGGDYHNGFAIRLPGVAAGTLPASAVQYRINGRLQSDSPLESTQGDAILVVAEDVWDYVSRGEGCRFHRTEAGCESDIQMDFNLRLQFAGGVPRASFPAAPYDPFLFATPGYDHGYLFSTPPGRSLEVHLPGQQPTAAFEYAYLGLGDDRSDEEQQQFFRSETGMPWALHIADEWKYPLEYIDITDAYPRFQPFVESTGETDGNWYVKELANAERVFGPEQQ